MRKNSFIFFWLLFLCSQAFGADVFVDNASSCVADDGTTAHPWCTIQDAINNAAAGQTIKIRSGTGVYSELANVSGKNGTSGSPIVIQPDTGAKFIIRNNAGEVFDASIKVTESDYWQFRNLVFDGASVNPSWNALHVQCETRNCVGIVIDGNTFRNWTTTSTVWEPHPLYVAGCSNAISGGCSDHDLTATITNNTWSNNEGTALEIIHTLDVVFSGNDISGQKCANDSSGGDRWTGIHATYDNSNLTIEDNYFHDFQSFASCTRTLGSNPVIAGYWCDVSSWTAGRPTAIIRRNRVGNINAGSSGLNPIGAGFFIEAGCDDHQVYNNVIWNITGDISAGIIHSYHSNAGTMSNYYNNTIQGSTYGFMTKEGILTVKNNIFAGSVTAPFCHGCTSGDPASVTLTSDFNLFQLVGSLAVRVGGGVGDKTLAQWRTYCGCDANSVSGDPKFVGPVPPGS